MSPSDPARAGMTLFEVLVVLAILALMTSLALGLRRGPSPALLLERQASELEREATRLRGLAISGGSPQALDAEACETDAEPVTFHPAGTANGGDICLVAGDHRLRLAVDPLTGILRRVDQ